MELEKANKTIKTAWVAAVVSGSVTLIVSAAAGFGYSVAGASMWNLIDVFFIFGMAYGIYRKSRVCAVIMLVYWVASKVLIFMEPGSAGGIAIAVLFGYFFFEGIRGTFTYHKITGSGEKSGEQFNLQ